MLLKSTAIYLIACEAFFLVVTLRAVWKDWFLGLLFSTELQATNFDWYGLSKTASAEKLCFRTPTCFRENASLFVLVSVPHHWAMKCGGGNEYGDHHGLHHKPLTHCKHVGCVRCSLTHVIQKAFARILHCGSSALCNSEVYLKGTLKHVLDIIKKMLPICHRGCFEPTVAALHAAENLQSRLRNSEKSLALASTMSSCSFIASSWTHQHYWLVL